ncbi:MAG TPA: hypothetical protein VLK33_22960 [Terriglobales bacterium]|nr:hypothetical protein [Terriglobales bacterium]
MQLIRVLAAPLFVLAVFIALTVVGVLTSGAGWVAVSLLCAWPLLWAVTAWTVKGLKITVAPTASAARQGQQRTREVLG